MPQNRIQFQPALAMDEFPERYGTKAQCEEALVTARRPQGFVCPQVDAGERLYGSWQMASHAWLQPAGVSAAWLIDDFLPDPGLFGNAAASEGAPPGLELLSSASSKTACATAAHLRRRAGIEVPRPGHAGNGTPDRAPLASRAAGHASGAGPGSRRRGRPARRHDALGVGREWRAGRVIHALRALE